ncbi:phosphonatase-like hydrolase [Pseudoclavibacter sp. AY1H1]|uniref:phosphonatase-like hydrolase n=1 Tax=Pseudoclavibacter sp. AY1H1 TaxID=2080584 RepID=UPI000CE8A513|nr:phosphonatase-like hydrolase [Pseudoclavibacter sp. AY1H1]PPF37032.1 phosphonatase-like hydrolase [Pseudoclavibacter sp. AY1H1]
MTTLTTSAQAQAQTQAQTAASVRVPLELVVLDMAGTTVLDDGVVERAFERAANRTGVAAHLPWPEALAYVRETMGQSKLDVFTHLADGDTAAAAEATAAFELAYAELVEEEGVEEIPGARETIESLRDAGLSVVLTTGFAPVTRDAILRALGWEELVDLALSPADVGRGRPAPDLVLSAVLRTGTSSVAAVAVVGDTASDVQSGLRAGAGLAVGVLSGAHDQETLEASGAHAVIDSVAALRELPAFQRPAS